MIHEVMHMELAGILLRQLLVMLVYMAIGFTLYKTGLITKQSSRALTNLLLYVVMPSVILKSFWVDRTPELTRLILISFAAGVLVLLLAMAVAALIFRRRPVDNFAASFSNAGFIGIPLITAALGVEAVCFLIGLMTALNVFQWTYGQALLSGDRSKLSPRAFFQSPLVLASVAGLVFFFTGLRLPDTLAGCVEAISDCNAPVAMILLGVFLGQIPLREVFTDAHAYACSAVRLVLIPLLTVLLLWPLPASCAQLRLTLLIAAAAPVGANVATYTQKLNLDCSYASKVVCLSTILSVVTLPLIILLAEALY